MRSTIGVGAVSLLLLAGCNNPTKNLEIFQADLSPANEVPAHGTAANGTAGFVWDGTTMTYSLQVDDITNITASHIHTGVSGANGPVRVTLYKGPVTSTTDTEILAEGSFTQTDNNQISMNDLLAAMRSGGAYVNVHTSAFPGGEMRGQVRVVNHD